MSAAFEAVTVVGGRETTHASINDNLGAPNDPVTNELFAFVTQALARRDPDDRVRGCRRARWRRPTHGVRSDGSSRRAGGRTAGAGAACGCVVAITCEAMIPRKPIRPQRE